MPRQNRRKDTLAYEYGKEVDNTLINFSEYNKKRVRVLVHRSGKTFSEISTELYGCRTTLTNMVAENRPSQFLTERAIRILCRYFDIGIKEFYEITTADIAQMESDIAEKQLEKETLKEKIKELQKQLKERY